jgi:hypothetical protein
MQETSDGNDKIKAKLSKMADEIEAELSRMKTRIAPQQQEPPTFTEPDEAVSDLHQRPNKGDGTDETPPEPCGYGQRCRFLSQGKCRFWHHSKTISLPRSGRFASGSEFPGTDIARVRPEEHVKPTPEYQYQSNKGNIVRVISIPMCMS